MKIKYGEISEKIAEFLESVPKDSVKTESLILTNGKWNVYLDYNGEDEHEALDVLRGFAHYKKNLIEKIIVSDSISDIIGTSVAVSEYFEHRGFTVSIEARNNIFLSALLRIRVFMLSRFGI